MTSNAFLLVAMHVQAEFHPAAEAQVFELAKQAVALRSVRGEGNQTPEVAELFNRALLEGGWPEHEIEIVPYEYTAYLIAKWPGTDPSLDPNVVSAHMDVVEAKPKTGSAIPSPRWLRTVTCSGAARATPSSKPHWRSFR